MDEKKLPLTAHLQELRKRNARIVTVEEPVEYSLPGLVQIPVGVGTKNLDFQTVLRHILRHDPDVILVGEIRDEETARVAINAAMTGHLVFSTLHSMDSVSTIERLVDLKVPPYLVASTLSMVIAQRLVKLNCPHCLAGDDISGLEHYGITPDLSLKMGAGCSHCGDTGLVGRSLISEVMQVTPDMRGLIRNGVLGEPLRKLAREGGMPSLWDNALDLAKDGKIGKDELMAYQLSAYT
jgi:type IV pilus assembly protein PilB